MKLSECKMCSLYKNRTQVVKPIIIGKHPNVMFIAEAPGRQEDIQGLPLRDTGRNSAGYWHWNIAKRIGVDKSCICMNTVQCRPVTKDGKNGKPTAYQLNKCQIWLRMVYEKYKPRVIILYGVYAAESILGYKSAMKNIVGKFFKTRFFGDEKLVYVMYHPSNLSYNNPKYKPLFNIQIQIIRKYLYK